MYAAAPAVAAPVFMEQVAAAPLFLEQVQQA